MKFYRLGLFFVFTCAFVLAPLYSHAQMSESEKQAQEAKWREELAATEKEIAQWETVLSTTKQGTASLQRDASILQAKINEAKAFIRQRQIQIEQLTRDIGLKTETIGELEAKMGRGKESLAAILRSTNEIDEYSIAEVMLSNKDLSEFFADIDSYNTIKSSPEDQFNEIRGLQAKTDAERKVLDEKRSKEADTKAKIESDKKKVEIDEKEKQKIITINQTQEKTYAKVIAEKKAKAAQIRAALFGLRDTTSIPFGTAYGYALDAQKSTGIDPAFLLAIFMQESGADASGTFGKNTGSCYLKDSQTGNGVGANTGTAFAKVMNPTRDVPPFLSLMSDLSYAPYNTKISCPQSIGWGGAMGPAQFIPSTWALFIKRITGITGNKLADPWNPKDAFIAASLYLTDLGASSGSYTSEIKAACKYSGTGGTTCTYGKQVMAKAPTIQLTMIDPLEGF